MIVTILRGGSGCGKSTWAAKHGNVTVSTDSFFMKDNVYQFDVEKLGEAHTSTFKRFIGHCQKYEGDKECGDLHLVVDNTNTSLAEFGPYAQVAAAYGHEVKILTFVYDPVAAFQRNVHGSPLNVCMRQHMRLMRETELIPSWWKHEFILEEDIPETE